MKFKYNDTVKVNSKKYDEFFGEENVGEVVNFKITKKGIAYLVIFPWVYDYFTENSLELTKIPRKARGLRKIR